MKALILISVLLLAGCSAGEQATEQIPGACGWSPPPTDDQIREFGESPEPTLSEVAPQLFEEKPQK